MAMVKVHTDPVELGKIPITWINVSIIQKTLTASPATKKASLGGSKHTKGSGFHQKELLEVSNANGEFNISVHILSQKLDQYRHVGGNISNHFAQWVKITKDSFVLDIVRSGLKTDFFERPVCYDIKPYYSMSDTEKDTVNSEIEKLLQKRIIVPTSYSKGDLCQVFSPGQKQTVLIAFY